MSPKFSSIFEFLGNCDQEVQGRSQKPPAEIEAELMKLIGGDLSGEERLRAFELLRDEPQWIAWLAGKIKERRDVS